jgi:DNA-binding NtrC family response regulator
VERVTNRRERLTSPRRALLRVLFGPDAGTEIAIPPVGIVVGASTPSDVELADPDVSARHLSVRPMADGFEVKDLGSTNGTFVDQTRIDRAIVPSGTTLRVGATLLQLLPDETAVEIPPSERESFGALVGSSVAMRRVYAILERVAPTNAPVLLLGESGTGKELSARAIHANSKRAAGPFVTFDCGAVAENLIESDLFGHVRGAFTGAANDRPGAFELAEGGTLLLDEIGDLPLRLQPKLLRVLETGETTPLGGKKPVKHDVRIIAATHKDLTREVARGTFRGDLYYRLAVVELELPPLRARVSDIPLMVAKMLEKDGANPEVADSNNLRRLTAYGWPGNARELRNVIGRAVALSPPGTRFADMPILVGASPGTEAKSLRVTADRPYHEAKAELLNEFDTAYLTDLFERVSGNVAQAARVAGVERRHLYRMMERANMTPPKKESDGD